MSIIPQNEPEISHILAIDFGESKVGLALADNETKIAFSYSTIKNDPELLGKIIEIIKKENVNKIIIGVPVYKNKEEKNDQEIYIKFGENLKNKLTDVEIIYFNEMFTTKMAGDNLKEKGMKNIQKADDAEAARIILESWLEKTYGIKQ
jgi:putative Holliday junction resolvase